MARHSLNVVRAAMGPYTLNAFWRAMGDPLVTHHARRDGLSARQGNGEGASQLLL